jgi:hypothetical protein
MLGGIHLLQNLLNWQMHFFKKFLNCMFDCILYVLCTYPLYVVSGNFLNFGYELLLHFLEHTSNRKSRWVQIWFSTCYQGPHTESVAGNDCFSAIDDCFSLVNYNDLCRWWELNSLSLWSFYSPSFLVHGWGWGRN